MHMPKGGMLTIGAKSMIVPAGMLVTMTLIVVELKVEGAAPKVQAIVAPVQTSCGI